jgi:dihydroxyacid dehydratase/phosphogluconate dehydratase
VKLRSAEWYAGDDRNAYLHRAWMRRGVPSSAFEGRPQIAIANTASDLTPCNAHLNEVADAVQRGVRGGHPVWDADIITPREAPLQADAGIAVLRGNLAPRGAIVKPAAASPDLLVLRGPAVVFDSVEDLHARVDDPALSVTADSVLVLRGCGPKGYPGMPEVANLLARESH